MTVFVLNHVDTGCRVTSNSSKASRFHLEESSFLFQSVPPSVTKCHLCLPVLASQFLCRLDRVLFVDLDSSLVLH